MKQVDKHYEYGPLRSVFLSQKARNGLFLKVIVIFLLLPIFVCLLLPTKDGLWATTLSNSERQGLGYLPSIDQFLEGDLKLSFQIDQGEGKPMMPVAGVPVKLYRVGQLKKEGTQAPLTSEWASAYQSLSGHPFSLGESSDKEYTQIKMLLKHIKSEQIPPDQEGVSDSQGEIFWTGLPSGIYLVSYAKGDKAAEGDYVFQDFYINLPNPYKDKSGNYTWQSSLIAKPKLAKFQPLPTTPTTTAPKPTRPPVKESQTTPKPTQPLARTGESRNFELWSLILCLSAILLVFMRQREKFKEDA